MPTSGDNLQFFRSRASTSEYEQLPINCRLFQNTVNLQDNTPLRSQSRQIPDVISIEISQPDLLSK